MVLFLQAYKNRFSSIEDYQFQRAFSYAVYAHLHILDLDEEERKAELERRYGKKFLTCLEKVAQETMHINHKENSDKTRKLLENCLQGKNEQFSKDILHEIASFLPIGG